MPYSVHESALYALLAIDDRTLRRLVSALEQIESNPLGHTHAAAEDIFGEVVNICFVDRYRIHFVIEKSGTVSVRDILRR